MGARLGLETFTRVAEILFPWFMLLFVVFVVSLITATDMHKILPVFDQGLKPVFRGAIPAAAFPFMELVLFMMLFPSMNRAEEMRRGMLLGATLGGIILIITTVLTILVVGAVPSARYAYPGYALARRINIGDFFQRVEAILALMWTITFYFKIMVYF
ncbi:GerAB/ArcD/ProY family transporter [Paenibacillus haidiansis]|uniref:Spore germination protein n=1 Tax=Paenibacillus oralis TaxID=2490856 RepID=A0A3P3TXU6_9BACL|nr:hypothetical protein EHV15_08380 [Paenibacillus oralis]